MPDPNAKHLFSILVNENGGMLMTYLRSMVWKQDVAEDLFQETMLVAWRKIDQCDLDRPFGPWLRGIATKLVLKHRSKSYREMMVCSDEVIERIQGHFAQLDHRIADTFEDKISILHECIDALPVDHKQAIQMCYMDGDSLKESADKTETTYEAMKKRLQRARTMLIECLARKGIIAETESP